jgi:hypothetical protein
MRRHFPKPEVPMGEPWFMSDQRKMYTELVDTPFSELSVDYLQGVLFDIAAGKDFDPDIWTDEWKPWSRYILSEVILRANQEHVFFLLESIVTTFVVTFGQNLQTEYPEFRRDIIDSLAIAIMNPGFWPQQKNPIESPAARAPDFLLEEHHGKLHVELVGFGQAPQVLSSAMCFCLKYLAPDDMASWVDSIFAIEHLHWRLAFFVWLLGARRFLAERTIAAIEETIPEIDWHNSFLLEKAEGPLIARENALAFVDRVRTHLTHDAINAWTERFRADDRIGQLHGLNWLMSRIHSLCYRDGGLRG